VHGAERHGGDRAGGGRDRAAARLRAAAASRRGAVEAGLDAKAGWRAQHHPADRGGVVERVSGGAPQRCEIERARTPERALAVNREQKLHGHRRPRAADVAGERQKHRNGGLAAGTERAIVGVRPAAVDEDRLYLALERGRVEVRAQQQA